MSGRGWQQLLSTIICASFLFVFLPPTYTLSLPETEPIYENIENVGGRLSLSNGALAGYYVSEWIWAAEGSELDWAENEPELAESFESAPSRVVNLPDGTGGFGLLFEGRPEAEEMELFLSGWGENAKLYVWSGGWESLGELNENFQRRFQLRPASRYLSGTDVWVKLEGRVELEGARLISMCTHKSKVFVQISDESGRWFGANGENSYFDSPPIPVEGRFRFRVEMRRDSPSLNPWFEFRGLRKGKPKWVAKVDPDLLRALENCPPDNEFFVIIFLKEQPWIPKELKRAELPEKAKYLRETVLPRQEKLLSFLRSKHIQVKYRFWLYNAVAAVVPARFVEEVAKLPFIWYVYWDRPLPLEPCDDISVQNVRATDVHTATPENYTGAGVKVGILGSGIKNDVPWLQRGGTSVVVKDFRGDLNAESATDVWDIGGAYTDDSHETNVACVLAGQAPENIGVAPGVDVYDLVFFDTSANAYASYLINCVQYAASENVSILSMSYGMTSYIAGTPPTYYIYPYTYRYPHSEIAERAVQLGIFFVNAAGNEGPATASLRSSIAGAEAIMTAGGYWDADTVAPEDDNFYCPAYSNPQFFSKGPGSFGTFKPEIVAPAAKIWVQNADNTFSEVGGTSFAAPHVAGGAALIKQRHPDWGPWEIKMALVNSARRMGDNHPFLQGAGALNCYKAVFNDVLIGVPQWYDYRIPSSGGAGIFRQEDQESDNVVGAELALSPTWTVTLPPGENTSTIIYIMNHRSTPLNLSFSYQTFPDIDNSSRPLNATFTVPSPITVPAGASVALPLRLSLAAGQYPGIYAAFLEFSDGENTFRVPVSVVVPAILSPGTNQLTFTYNHVFGAQDDVDEYDMGGEWHLLPFFISSPASNVTATWTFASGGYDFSLMDSIGREDRNVDNHAWMASTSPTSLTLTGVKPGLWWISSHYYTGSGDTYQAKIDLNGSDAVQISSAVFYSPLTQTLDLLARVVGIGGGANISSVSFIIYKDNSQHLWSTYPDYNISDISAGLGGSLQNMGSGFWSVRGFDASSLYQNSGPGAYYALMTADNGTAKWTGASPLFFVPEVRVKAWALRTGFENVLVYTRADCFTHGSIDNTKVRLTPSYAVFEVGPDNLRGTTDDNFQFSGTLSWNPQLSRWEAVLDTSSIDENRCYAVVTFVDNWLHCSCGATNLFYASEWVQTDWKGGPTPSLQAGTWMEDYDNFYSGENMDYSGAGRLRLAVENYENFYTYVTSYAAITGAVDNFENQQSADDAGAYSTLQGASGTLTIFYDGFESGGFTEGGWVLSSPAPVVSTDHPYQGSYAAGGSVAIFGATTNTYSFAKTLNTSGYSNVTLSYARAVEDAGAGSINFVAEYSTDGGSTWTSLESVSDTNNAYSVVSFSVPSVPQLIIRFRGTFSGAAQARANCFWVDEVRVTGDAYTMEIRENISGLPQADNYFLEIRYALDNTNENFRLEVWNGSSWEPVMDLTSTAWVENSVQLGPQHLLGSTVMVRFVNATVGGLATNLLIDYLRVRSVVPRFKPAGWLESSAFDSRSVADWGPVRWNAEIPAQTSVRVWIRSSSDAANWGPWCLHENNTENSSLEDDRYVQYRIEFFTDNAYLTPKLYDITIPFRPWWWGPPEAPSLLSPENGTRDSENTPTFVWTGGRGMKRFWLQIDNDSDLSSPVYDNRNILSIQTSCRIENELTVGTYYWRVVAANAFGENSSETWTYVCIPPYWRTLEGWTGTAAFPATGWFQLETWQGELGAGAWWGVLEDLQGTVLAAVAWYEVESCQGGVGTTAGWQFLEGWQGTLSTTAAWWQIESWSGTLQALAGWVGVEGWGGGIGTTANWLTIEFCSGTVRATASWLQMEGLSAGVQTSALWQPVEGWAGTCATAIGWLQLELWQAGTSTTAGWIPVGSLQATCAGAVNWRILESWSGALQATAGWSMLESWSCSVAGAAGWITLERWTAGAEAVASWFEVESLQGTCSSPSQWQVVDSWMSGGLTAAGWYLLESIAGQLGSQAYWTQVDTCSGLVYTLVSWEPLENWEGAISSLAGWSQLEVIQATLGATAGWQSLDSWAGTIGTLAGWVSVEGLSGTVSTSAGWMEIELCTGGIQTLASWLTTEGWGCGVGTLVEWQITDSWTCVAHAQAGWLWSEGWSGALTSKPQWAAVDQWTGSVHTPAFWQGVEGWSGAVVGWSAWRTVESWSGEVQAFVLWACLEGWSGTASAPASWWEVEGWTDNVYAYALPGAPVLLSPENNATVILPLTFTWIRGANADNHRIEIDNNPDFSSPEENVWRLPPDDNWYTSENLDYGTYYWRVWAVNANGENCSENVWTFTLVAVWRTLESWTGRASSIPPAWSATDSWTCTACTLSVWSTMESWTGALASVPPLWSGIDSWSDTASTIPVWSAIDSWTCATSSPAVWITIDSWSGTASSIPPAWSSIESWAGTASSLPAWIAIDSWTGTASSIAPSWSVIESWICTTSSITPAWSSIECWICASSSVPPAWSSIESWICTTASIPPVWSAIESCAGEVGAPAGWTVLEFVAGEIRSPASWQILETWTCTISSLPAWSPVESWACTISSVPTAWSAVDAWTCTTASVPPAWSSIDSCTCTATSVSTWATIDSWTCAAASIPVWSSIESWAGTTSSIPPVWTSTDSWACTASSVSAWSAIDSWVGEVCTTGSWKIIDSWTCTLISPSSWQCLEALTGSLGAPSEWNFLEVWVETIQAPTQWQVVETWAGTASTLGLWSMLESWTGTVSAFMFWRQLECWEGVATAPAGWAEVEGWGGTAQATAGWLMVDSLTGSACTLPGWSTLESWSGRLEAAAWWAITDWWEETLRGAAEWQMVESCSSSVHALAVWSTVEGWSGTVGTAAGWSALEAWAGTSTSAAAWCLIDVWQGGAGGVAAWVCTDSWIGGATALAGWSALDSCNGSVNTLASWIASEGWDGTLHALAGWQAVEGWDGTVSAIPTWRALEGWEATLHAPAGWTLTDSCMGAIRAPSSWSTLEGWVGSVQTLAAWSVVETWTGAALAPGTWIALEGWDETVEAPAGWRSLEGWQDSILSITEWVSVEGWSSCTQAPATGWQALEGWEETAGAPAGWTPIDSLGGITRAQAWWAYLEGWSGTVVTTAGWLGIEAWEGGIQVPFTGWLGIEAWTGRAVTVAEWSGIEFWAGTLRTQASWLIVEARSATICAPAGWLPVDSWAGGVQTQVAWSVVEELSGAARTTVHWLGVEGWTGTLKAPAGWVAAEGWEASAAAPLGWYEVEGWSGEIRAPASWCAVEDWAGTLCVPAGWLAVDSCTGTAQTWTSWQEIEGWIGAARSIAGWSTIESCAGGVGAPAEWTVLESASAEIGSPASWQTLETRTCTASSVPPTWSTADSWVCTTASIPPAWSAVDSWSGTTASIPLAWATVESWICTLSSIPSWSTLESWAGATASVPPVWSTTESWACAASSIPPAWSVMESWAGTATSIPAWSSIESWTGTTFSPSAWNVMDSWTVAAYSLTAWSAIDLWTCTTASIPPAWLTIDSQACMASSIPPAWSAIESWTCMLPATASWLTLESQAGTARSPAFWELGESWDCSSSAPFAGWSEVDRWTGVTGTFMPEWLSVEGWSGTTQFLAAWLGVEAWTQEVGAAAGWQMVEGYGVCLENLVGWSLLELWESGISSTPAMWFRLEQLEGSASAPPRWTCLESWLNTANFAAGWTPIDSRATSLSSVTSWRTLETCSGEMGSPPAPPTLILPENASTTTPTPTFQWGATSPLDNFRLEVDNDSDFSSPEDNLTFNRNVTSWTKPVPGYAVDNYYWRVWAVNRFGESCSTVRVFRVLLGPPTQPVLLSPENGSPTWTVITLAWRRAERADNHRIEISTDPDFRALVENTYLLPPNDNSYTALLSGPGVYYWRVRGVNPLGENCSEIWSFRAYLAAPRLLSPADGFNTNTPPTLLWENLTPVDNFELQVDNDQDFSSPEVRVSLTETSYTISVPDGLYYWRVRAFRWGENSPWSIRTFRIDTVPPSRPTLLFPVNVSTNDNTPLFQWLHVPENSLPVAYWIQIDNDQTFNEPYVFSFGWILDNKFEFPGENSLRDGVYYWRIRARDNAGNLGLWSSASFRVDTQAPPAPAPSAPVDGAWASIRPVLSWQSVQDPSSVQYKVYLCEQPSFSIPYRVYESDWLTENSWQAPVLEEALGLEGKFFYWKVCARDGAGNVGENSPTENFRVDNYVAKVTLLSPENGSLVSRTVRFEWYSVTDASGISGYWFQLSTSEEFTYLLENVEVEENWYMTNLYLPGNYYWRVCAIDNVGNRGPWSDCFTVRVSGWVSLESWESRAVGGAWWRPIESLQAGTAVKAWREIESMRGGMLATADWRRLEGISSIGRVRAGWSPLESRSCKILTKGSWRWVEGEGLSLSTPAAPVPVPGAWNLLERGEGRIAAPSSWSELETRAASTFPIVLSISPERASVEQGGTVYAIVRVESVYTKLVRLETDTLPGATFALLPPQGVPAFQSILRIEVGVSVQVGTYELGIYARTDGLTVRRAFVLEIRPATRSAPFVSAGASSRFDFTDLRTPINRVEIEAIEDVVEPYLTIEFLKQLPPGIPVPELPVYVYARVRTNVPNRSARFSFTVEDSWLRAQEAGAKLVCMLRLGERWEEISARFTGENAGEKMYEVTVPRLSEVTMLAIACKRPMRVPLASIVLGLALGAGIGLGGWFLLHLLRPKPSFRPPREVLERVRRTIELGPAMPPQRVILERYKKAVVYKKKPKFRTVEGMAETSKVKELWEKVSRQVRPEVPRPEERVERLESEKEVTHPKKPTIEKLWERVNQQVRKRGPVKKAVAYKRRPKMVRMAEPREIAEELWRRVSRRIRKK